MKSGATKVAFLDAGEMKVLVMGEMAIVHVFRLSLEIEGDLEAEGAPVVQGVGDHSEPGIAQAGPRGRKLRRVEHIDRLGPELYRHTPVQRKPPGDSGIHIVDAAFAEYVSPQIARKFPRLDETEGALRQ